MNEVARAVLQKRYDELAEVKYFLLKRESGARQELLEHITQRATIEAELAELEDALNPQQTVSVQVVAGDIPNEEYARRVQEIYKEQGY